MAEKSINDIPRELREPYERGLSAINQGNVDYALQLLTAVLKTEPAFLAAREALRKAQLKKAGQASDSLFKKMIGTASSSPMLAKAKLEIGKDPLEAMQTLEGVLNSDPRNTSAHRMLAEAATAADLPRTAVLSLEALWGLLPGDREVGLELVESYMKAGFAARTHGVFKELLRRYPNDPIINRSYKNISATRTLDEKGYGALESGTGSYRDVLKDKAEAVSLEQQNRQVKDEDVTFALIREKESKLQSEPMNLKVARDIAELYAQRKDYDRAMEYYEYIQAVGGGADSAIEKGITDLKLKKLDRTIGTLDVNVPEQAAEVEKLRAERLEFQLVDALRRIEKYPTDLLIRFELGMLYFNAGKLKEAIQELQKARANAHKRTQAINYLGQCFALRGMNEMAAQQFRDAIKEKSTFDEEKKDLTYQLACVLQKMGKADEAVKQFEVIYQEDIGYRDVAERVDAYYASK